VRAWFLALPHSLGVRLLAPLFLTVGVVLAVYAWFSFRSTQEHVVGLVRAEASRSSELIRRATHDGMLLNQLDEVQATIERLAEGPEVAAIRVYDKEGGVVLSAHTEEIGSLIALEATPCSGCHPPGEPVATDRLESSHLISINGQEEVLRHLSVIMNEPDCAASGCHASPSQQKLLGILEVEMSMAPLEATLSAAQRQLVWTTLALVLIIGVVAAVFIRRVVHRPISKLLAGTQRISAGDLATRIDVPGRHELAGLARAFNRMAEDLSRAQSELTEWSHKLEDKVVEKTEELQRAQRQVLHMEKMASLGKLSATVAHELNNPISGVLTYARLVERELEEQPLPKEVRDELGRYLNLIEKECSRCGSIVQNLLVFARRRGAEMAPLDLNEIIDRSVMLVRHHLEISGVQLRNEPLAGDSEIVADAGQLQQALVALLVNAVEAMEGPSGDKELTVRARGDTDEVFIDISDTGVGISPEVLPSIFEPFFSTKGAENGVGLGLAVVYGIVNRHGGTIEVESEVGSGTVFHLRLPRKPDVTEDEAFAASDSPVAAI
jgi:two-component system NtrC family sensor kinase